MHDYYYEVVDAATAIFLHNFYRYSDLDAIYGKDFLCDYPSPLGYLLCLSDTLCEWSRSGNVDAKYYGVMIDDQGIFFKVPKSARSKVRRAVQFFDPRIDIRITDRWDGGRNRRLRNAEGKDKAPQA